MQFLLKLVCEVPTADTEPDSAVMCEPTLGVSEHDIAMEHEWSPSDQVNHTGH